jgi:cystathionine beta-lyase/cystathionine gamma-synthase
MSKMRHFDTLINHPKPVAFTGTNRPVVSPIHQSVKYTADTLSELKRIFTEQQGQFVYSRLSNPTVRELEQLIATLQEQEDGLCVASGVAALHGVFMSILKAGDHVLMFYESYKPTRYLVCQMLAKFGVSSSLVHIDETESLDRSYLAGKTKLFVFESPTNPMTRIVDLEKIIAFCKQRGIVSVLDNTFAGFHNHGTYDIDLFVHSLTKFAGGHGDAMGGAILGKKALIKSIHKDVSEIGAVLDPHAAFLMLRGLKTYSLRYQRQCENALVLAQWLEQQEQIARVYYPGLKTHPDHELAKKQMHDFGSIIAIELNPEAVSLEAFIDALELFQISASLGSTESLVAPVELFYGGDLSPEQKKRALISPHSLRLAIGIEHVADLQADLLNALQGH